MLFDMINTPLRAARLDARKKLRDVANAVRTSEGNLSRIECGKQTATAELAEKLARYFGTVTEVEILYPERFVEQKRQRGRATA